MSRARARIERFDTIKFGDVATNTRAVIACGCSVFVGVRADAPDQAVTMAHPCCEPHRRITDRFNDLMLEDRATNHQHTLLVEVAARLLSQAAIEMRPSIAEEVGRDRQ